MRCLLSAITSKLSMYMEMDWVRAMLISLALAATVYAFGLKVLPCGDEWEPMFAVARCLRHEVSIIHTAFRAYGPNHWFPLAMLTMMLGQYFSQPPQALGIQVLNAGAFFLSLFIFFRLAALFLSNRVAVLLGALLLCFHQASIGVLFQFDSNAHMFADALGRLSVYLIVVALLRRGGDDFRRGVIAGLVLLGALMYKTRAFSYGAMIVLLGLMFLLLRRKSVSSVLRSVAPALIACILFVLLRHLAIGSTLLEGSGDRYFISGPIQWILNIVQLSLATWTPINTIAWYDAIVDRSYAQIALYSSITLAFAVLILWGISIAWKREKLRGGILICLIGLVAAWFPTGLLGRVSEHYASPGIYWYCLLLVLALEGLRVRVNESGSFAKCQLRRSYVLAVMAVLLLLALHFSGFITKRALWIESGARGMVAIEQALMQLREVPEGAVITIMQGPDIQVRNYSFYRADAYTAVQKGLAVVYFSWKLRLPLHFNLGESAETSADYILYIDDSGAVLQEVP